MATISVKRSILLKTTSHDCRQRLLHPVHKNPYYWEPSSFAFRKDGLRSEKQVAVSLWHTVEPPVSDHPKCKDLVATYWRWSLTRIEPQGASSRKRSEHIYFMEDNLLHTISNLRLVQFHVVTKVLRTF